MKPIYQKILLSLWLFIIICIDALAYDAEIDAIYYNFSGNDAIVTYNEEKYDLGNDYSGAVVIPERVTYNGKTYNVTNIGDYAFYDCNGLTSVTIPESVTSIANFAFYGCRSLTSMTIPKSVTSIGNGAFQYCIVLTSIIIPENVTAIGNQPFYGCTNLTAININCETIGRWFDGTESLQTIIIGNNVKTIGEDAFYFCENLTTLNIPEGVTSIGENAFGYCFGLTDITIPESVKYIGNGAFSNCWRIKKAKILSPAETCWGNVFQGCQLDTVVFGENVSPNLWGANSSSSVSHVIIMDGINFIGDEAFRLCWGLESVSLPNSVIYIGNNSFYGCSSLTSINFPDNLKSIGNSAFLECHALSSIIIPESVTNIGEKAFDETEWYYKQPEGLVYVGKVAYKFKGTMPDKTRITIMDGTLGIAGSAFSGCGGIASVTIPESITNIGNNAFVGCSKLKNVLSLVKEPFPIDESVFDKNTYNSTTIIVPIGTIEAYKSTDIWKNFMHITEMPQEKPVLILWAKNGSVVAFALSKKPKLTFTDTDLQITGENFNLSYAIDDIARFTYESEDVATPIKDIETEDVLFKHTGESLSFPSLKANSTLSVYSLTGTLVFRKTVQTAGDYSFPLSNLTSGVYLVSINGITYKIAKK